MTGFFMRNHHYMLGMKNYIGLKGNLFYISGIFLKEIFIYQKLFPGGRVLLSTSA